MNTEGQGQGHERFDATRSRTFCRILDHLSLRQKKVLDIGCGFGEHLACFGKGSMGLTTRTDEVAYGKEHRLDISLGNAELIDETPLGSVKFDAIWANNLFEHLLAPHAFLIRLKAMSSHGTVLVLGVPVIPRIASLMKIRKFRGALAGAHVNFFTRESLRLTVERAGWSVRAMRPFKVKNRLIDEYILGPFMPHLYVVASDNLRFRYADSKLREWQGASYYDRVISIVRAQG